MSLREEKIVAFQREVAIELAAERWKEKMALLKEAEKEAELAKEELLTACNRQSYEGKGVKVAEIERLGSIEYQSIPELKNVNLEAYRKAASRYFKITLSLIN